MTDNKIILGWCRRELCPSAQEIINRQQAEIERAKEINEQLYEEMSERQKEEVSIAKRMARKKAIKEFAEMLKEKTYPFPCAIGVENAVTIRAIDDLVKEMVGEE